MTNAVTNTGERQKAFAEFLKRVGVKRFGPEFVDSLIAVMRDTANSCLSEQAYAWTRWRAWCNSSEFAVSDWNPKASWHLDQIDFALDLAWLQEGRPVEWIEGMPKEYRQKVRDGKVERPKGVTDPAQVSRAFTRNEDRGTIFFDGRKLGPVISPPEKPTRKLTDRTTFEQDSAFLEAWKIDGPHNFQQWLNARTAYFEARKLGRTAYQAYRDRTSSESRIIIDVNGLDNVPNNSTGGRASLYKDELSAEEPPARPVEDDRAELKKMGRRRYGSPEWHDRVANFLETLPLPTVLDRPMLLQITDTLSEEVLDQFESACREAKGIRKWAGYLSIAKQVAARGVVKTMAAVAGSKAETDFERRYREEIERRRREEPNHG